jgi:hypothetical protein
MFQREALDDFLFSFNLFVLPLLPTWTGKGAEWSRGDGEARRHSFRLRLHGESYGVGLLFRQIPSRFGAVRSGHWL